MKYCSYVVSWGNIYMIWKEMQNSKTGYLKWDKEITERSTINIY